MREIEVLYFRLVFYDKNNNKILIQTYKNGENLVGSGGR